MFNHSCRKIRAALVAFASGELSSEHAAGVRAHLEACPQCAARLAQIEATSECLTNALGDAMTAPPTLDARVMATVRRLPPRASWARFAPPWSLASRARNALAVAGALGVGVMLSQWHATRPPAIEPLTTATLASTFRAMDTHVMVQGTDAQTIHTRLIEMAPAGAHSDLAALELHDAEARAQGGCWTLLNGYPVASFCFSWRGRRVSVWQTADTSAAPFYSVAPLERLSCVTWSEGGKRFALVVEATPEESLRLARALRVV